MTGEREAREGRISVDGGVVLRFAPHARFRFDEVRPGLDRARPRAALDARRAGSRDPAPDRTACEHIEAIIDELVRRYEAPRQVIAGDVVAMLQDLVDKKVLRR